MFGYKINQDDFDKYIEKMNNNELTVEDILDHDSIVRDLKTNSSSDFVSFLTNQNMKKLIDYVTKMPIEDDQKIGHKFPFNASEILCSNNMRIINKYFNDKNESEKSDNEEEKNEEESKNEESENDDLLNYLFNFLNSESNDMNYVLIGYFNKIINHLLQNKSSELLNYIFILHHETIFEGLIKHLNRRAIGETIKSILTYNEDNVTDLNLQRKKLIIYIIQELNENQDEEKCFCICETIINCISNKEFFVLFMLEKDLVSLLYSIIYKNTENEKNLRTLLNLMIKINEKILSLFDNLVTPNLAAENENLLNYDNDFDNNDNNEKNENLTKILSYLFNSLIEGNFIVFRNLNQFDNQVISTTYEQNQKKLGIKKIVLIEYLRSLIDILVNTNAKQILSKEINEIINIINNNEIFQTLNYILFNYEFNNIFQTLYLQLMTIILNENSPENLINGIFINNNPNELNLIPKLIDHTIHNIYFVYMSNRKTNSSILSIEVKLINDIINSENKHIKKLLENEKDLKVFYEVVISRLNNLFTKKLLYDSNFINFNFNENSNENLIQSTQSIEEIITEDLNIYDKYKKGENYLELQNAKIEREIAEKEKNNFNKLNISQELINDDDYNNDFNPYKEDNDDINHLLHTKGEVQEDNSQTKNNILTKGFIYDDDNENNNLNNENIKKDNKMKVEDLEDDFKIEENEDFKIEENDDEDDNINVKEYLKRQSERQMTEEDEENDVNDNKNNSDDDFYIPEYENYENKIKIDDDNEIEEFDIDNNNKGNFDKKNKNNHNINNKNVKVNNYFKPNSKKEEDKNDDIYIQIKIESKDNSNEDEESEEEEELNNKKENKKNNIINDSNEEEEKEDLEEEEEEEKEKKPRYLDRRNEINYWYNSDNIWDLIDAYEDLEII